MSFFKIFFLCGLSFFFVACSEKISLKECEDNFPRKCADGSVVHRESGNDCAYAFCPEEQRPYDDRFLELRCEPDTYRCADGKTVLRDPNNACNFFPCE